MRRTIQLDPLAAKLHQDLLTEAESILTRRPPEHSIDDGHRLLRESRLALKQISILSWAWRFTKDERYLKRAITELGAICAMKDWNTAHFLDTAEMAVAAAIGYDWLHDQLTLQQRTMCEQAIVDKALRPARAHYDGKQWWTDGRNNWGQVCGSGIAVAAIAIQGKDDGLSMGLIRDGLDLLKKCERFYAPDGVYPEGPGYWHYGTIYHTKLLAACQTLGHPVSIPDDLKRSGVSMMHMHGPSRKPFNFSDGKAYPSGKSSAQAWIATHFNDAYQQTSVREVIERALDPKQNQLKHKTAPLTLLWLPTRPDKSESLPLNAVMHGEQSTAVFRSHWGADASWLAIKGGTPHGGHGHMDVGSFCYDAHGMRWIHDLGGDNYNMPGYFHGDRFQYYRLQNRSHNTLEIDNSLQNPKSKPCPIIASDTIGKPYATLDLTEAYSEQAKAVIRTARFDPKTGAVTIHDKVTKPRGIVTWRIITDADCCINGDKVILSKQGKSIQLQRLSMDGKWRVTNAKPPQKIENPNEGFRVVSLTLPKSENVMIEVGIRP